MGSTMRARAAAATGLSLALFGTACLAPSSAFAGLLAESTAATGVAVATWSAIPTAAAGTTAVTSVNIAMGSKKDRYALIDIVNNGSIALTGFTLAANRAAAVSACGQTWTLPTGPGKNQPECATGANDLGSLSGSGTSRLSATVAIAAGARVRLRVGPFDAATLGSLAVTVTRANAA